MSARTIHPFPARMAPEIALNAIPERTGEPLTIIDPMCGSGTVLAAALQKGHNAIGIDIDPLAVMMSRLTVSDISTAEIGDGCKAALARARHHSGEPPWGSDAETDAFVRYWFGESQIKDLIALATAVNATKPDMLRLALQLGISRIIVTKSPQASLAADTAHSRPHRVATRSSYDVFEGFARSVSQMSRLLDARQNVGQCRVYLGDARSTPEIATSVADLAITSPPYLNALDYLRGHKLALVWFGHTVADLRHRRGVSIGAERAADRVSAAKVKDVVQSIEEDLSDSSRIKKGMLERFTQDCFGFAGELGRTVKPGGRAVLVVGNSSLRGNYIANDLIAQRAMEHAGFSPIDRYERDIPLSKRYMAIKPRNDGTSITKRMRKEVVLTMIRDVA